MRPSRAQQSSGSSSRRQPPGIFLRRRCGARGRAHSENAKGNVRPIFETSHSSAYQSKWGCAARSPVSSAPKWYALAVGLNTGVGSISLSTGQFPYQLNRRPPDVSARSMFELEPFKRSVRPHYPTAANRDRSRSGPEPDGQALQIRSVRKRECEGESIHELHLACQPTRHRGVVGHDVCRIGAASNENVSTPRAAASTNTSSVPIYTRTLRGIAVFWERNSGTAKAG